MKLIVGITGASGSIYAKTLLHRLTELKNIISQCVIIFTDNGKKVWQYELNEEIIIDDSNIFRIADNNNLFDAVASGSSKFDAMVIIPCSMATLARISNGIASDLLARCADVMLKERKKLILVPREAPYNSIHLKNMLTLSEQGVIIFPASPFFYHKPQKLEDIIAPLVERIIEKLSLPDNSISFSGI